MRDVEGRDIDGDKQIERERESVCVRDGERRDIDGDKQADREIIRVRV